MYGDVATGTGSTFQKKVLITEDDHDLREIYFIALKDYFKIKTAKDGEEAINISKIWKPDLVLMDLQLPGIDGLEASKSIIGIHKKVKVIAISAYDTISEKTIKNAGVLKYIKKPIRLKALVKIVKDLINNDHSAVE